MNRVINNFLPWLVALLVLAGLELLLAKPQWFYYLGGLLVLIIVISLWQLTNRKLFQANFWNFLITPLLLLLGGIALLFFIDHLVWRQVIIIILSSCYILLLYNITTYLHWPTSYQPYSLGNILSYLNLAVIFLIFSSLSNLAIFLNPPLWLQSAIALIVIFLLNYEEQWIKKIPWSQAWIFILSNTILILEFFLVTHFWPTSSYVKASIITLIYYLFNGLSSYYLIPGGERKIIKRYLIFTLGLSIIILITSRWV